MPDAIADLHAMGPAARRSILRVLAPEERKLVRSLLLDTNVPALSTAPETSNGHSSWLAALIEHAGTSESGVTRLTLAVRQHLARSAAPPTPARTSGRSLLDAVGGLGMGRRRPI